MLQRPGGPPVSAIGGLADDGNVPYFGLGHRLLKVAEERAVKPPPSPALLPPAMDRLPGDAATPSGDGDGVTSAHALDDEIGDVSVELGRPADGACHGKMLATQEPGR
jgi:hypothetical protein